MPRSNGWYWTYRRRSNGNDFSLAYQRPLEGPRRLCGEPGKDEGENTGAARPVQCFFLCPAPGGHTGGRVCHRLQLPEGNRSAADDFDQEALR